MAWLTVLGIPAAVYVVSITALMFAVSSKTQNIFVLAGTFLLTTGIYIFHRTAIVEVEPMQKRHVIASRHKKQLLAISFALLVCAGTVFAMVHLITTLLVVCSFAGVYAYGRKTIVEPLRMYPYAKPLIVGVAIALYAWVLNDFANSTVTVLAFSLICSADALVCDLVDREYDSATGCTTLATRLGVYWIWIISTATYLFATVVLLVAIEHSSMGFFLFIAYIVSIPFRKYDLRYLVDLRLGLALLLAWVTWMYLIGSLQ